MSRYELDARRLLCPMPVIRTQDRIKQLQHGDHLVIYATDPGALHDIPAWCRVHGHRLCSAETHGEDVCIEVEVCRQV